MDKDNPMAGTMKTMNMTMPLFSVFMVFTLPTGIGIYWIISALVRCVQQVFINKHLQKMSVEDLVEKNKEKAEKKRAKRSEKAEKINAMAQMNTKNISEKSSLGVSDAEKEKKLEKARRMQRMQKKEVLQRKPIWLENSMRTNRGRYYGRLHYCIS